jgi:hypothetical protein
LAIFRHSGCGTEAFASIAGTAFTILGKRVDNFSMHVDTIATFIGQDRGAMRVLLIPLVLFVYVITDITMNNGASVRGWLLFLSSLLRGVVRF